MGKMGFRGRVSVAGIDLGTTNSVICVQQQSDRGEVILSIQRMLSYLILLFMIKL